MLRSTPLDRSLSITELAALTPNRSPADLRELCREAAMRPLREAMRKSGFRPEALADGADGPRAPLQLRELRLADFFEERLGEGDGLIRDLD